MGCLRFLRVLSGICLHNTRKDTVSVSSRIPGVGIADKRQCFYLKNIFCFAGDDTGCFDIAVLGQHEHFTAFQITVYHGFLFIGQKQQVEVVFLIMEHRLYTYHSLLFEWVCMAKIILMGIEPNKTPGNIVDFQHGID